MSRLRRLFRFRSRTPKDIEADVRDEIRFHLEMRARELVERGLPEEAAGREARRQFGDLNATAAYCRRLDADRERRVRVRRYAAELWQDLTYGARMLLRQPGYTTVAVPTIALGICATTLVFSVVHASLLAPLPYAESDRLMVVRASLPDYADVRASTNIFEDSGVYASNLYLLDDDQILGGVVTPGFFSTLGVPPMIGRALDAGDGAAPGVVLSHHLWRRRFGADPGVIGRTIVLAGTAHTIVGVMPASFQFPSRDFELWVNIEASMARVPEQRTNRALRIFQAVARLRPEVTPAQAQDRLSALAERLAAEHPDTNAGIDLTLVPVQERLVGDVRSALLLAFGSVACLLFIACANVAGLTLARLTTRVQELAVRAAMGAGRWRIARMLAAESLLIAACGGAVGVLIAWWTHSALPALLGNRVPRVDEVSISLPVLALSLAATALAALLIGMMPVAQLSRARLEPALTGGPRAGASRSGVRLRSALVVVQIGLAVLVLAGALVLGRSFVRLLQVDPGFAPDGLLTFHVLLIDMPTPGARAAASVDVLQAIAAIPGVETVGGATGLPPITAQRGTTIEVEGRGDAPLAQRRAYWIAASPAYFQALGTRVIEGREFGSRDTPTAPRAVVISRELARRYFFDGNAVGRRLRLINPGESADWRTIVGVVENVRYNGLDDVDPPVVYVPFAQTPFPWMYVYVRARNDPGALLPAIRQAVGSVDPRLAVANPQPMTALIARSSADPRFRTLFVSLFAGAAVLLAGIGLYGVVAFSVARRAREIAIRVALGAPAASVRWTVVGHALVLVSTGLGLGLLGAWWAGGVLAGLLYETTPADPVAFAGVAALMLAIALVASLVPAHRAARIPPADALREV